MTLLVPYTMYYTPQDLINNYTCTCVDKYVGQNCSTFDDHTSISGASSLISVVIIVTVIVLIAIAAATAVIVISVCVCLRKMKNRYTAVHNENHDIQLDEK